MQNGSSQRGPGDGLEADFACLPLASQDMLAALDGLPDEKPARAAALETLVRGLTAADVQALDLRVVARLIGAVDRACGKAAPDLVWRLHVRLKPDPALVAEESAALARLDAAICADPRLSGLKAQWDGMSTHQRMDGLQNLADAATAAFGIEIITVGAYAREAHGLLGGGMSVNRGYFQGGSRVMVNIHPHAGFGVFATAADTMLHELVHVVQARKLSQWRMTRLPADDPWFATAALFHVSGAGASASAGPSHHYFTNPGERQARRLGGKAADLAAGPGSLGRYLRQLAVETRAGFSTGRGKLMQPRDFGYTPPCQGKP